MHASVFFRMFLRVTLVAVTIVCAANLTPKSGCIHNAKCTPFADAAVLHETNGEGKDNIHHASEQVGSALGHLISALQDLGNLLLRFAAFVIRMLIFPLYLLVIVVSFFLERVIIIVTSIFALVWWICTPIHPLLLDIARFVSALWHLVVAICMYVWAVLTSIPPYAYFCVITILAVVVVFNHRSVVAATLLLFSFVRVYFNWALALVTEVCSGLLQVAKLRILQRTQVSQAEIEVRLSSIRFYVARHARPPSLSEAMRRAREGGGNTDWSGSGQENGGSGERNGSTGAAYGSVDQNGGTTSGDAEALECTICLEDLHEPGKRVLALARCGHVFHEECIRRWLSVNIECPVDRTRAEEAGG